MSTGSLADNLADGEDGDHYWKNQDTFICDQNKSTVPLEACLSKNRSKNLNIQILWTKRSDRNPKEVYSKHSTDNHHTVSTTGVQTWQSSKTD